MPAGRPRKPVEVKRRTGRAPGRDSGGRKLPELAAVVALPMLADGEIPDPPSDLLIDGIDLWRQIWENGQRWISPGSDRPAVELACRMADDLALTRQLYRTVRDAAYGRLARAQAAELGAELGRLGFDPTSRGKLGVGEIKAATALEKLMAAHAGRR